LSLCFYFYHYHHHHHHRPCQHPCGRYFPSHLSIFFNISVQVICKNTDLTLLHKTDFSDNPQSGKTIIRPRKDVLWTDFLHICFEPLHFPLHCTGYYHRSSNSGLQRLFLLTGFAVSSVQTRCLGIQSNWYRNLRVVCVNRFFLYGETD
jgi:hypothetical protein